MRVRVIQSSASQIEPATANVPPLQCLKRGIASLRRRRDWSRSLCCMLAGGNSDRDLSGSVSPRLDSLRKGTGSSDAALRRTSSSASHRHAREASQTLNDAWADPTLFSRRESACTAARGNQSLVHMAAAMRLSAGGPLPDPDSSAPLHGGAAATSELLLDAPSFAFQCPTGAEPEPVPDAIASPTGNPSEPSSRLPELPTIRLPTMACASECSDPGSAGSTGQAQRAEAEAGDSLSQPLFSFPSTLHQDPAGASASLPSGAGESASGRIPSLSLECSQSFGGGHALSGDLLRRSPPHAAAACGDAAALRELLAGSSSPQDLWTDLGTPLHCAVQRNSDECVAVCLEAGLDVDAENGEGLTPLMLAAAMGHEAVMLRLLDGGASILRAYLPGAAENLLHFCVEHVCTLPLICVRALWHACGKTIVNHTGRGHERRDCTCRRWWAR